jgi:hypothetical protein
MTHSFRPAPTPFLGGARELLPIWTQSTDCRKSLLRRDGERLFELVERLRTGGITTLMLEQNVKHVRRIADPAYLLENDHVVLEDTGLRPA